MVKDMEINQNKLAKIFLEAELNLRNEEKQVKGEINVLLNRFRELNNELAQNRQEAASICHENFSELKRQIDIRREELKAKIDEIALSMIEKAN